MKVVDVLILLLILMLAGSLPVWRYSRNWGYTGTAGIGGMLVIILILLHFYVF